MHVDVPEFEIADRAAIDPASTALVIVDMQNDFVHDGGALQVPDAAATIPAIERLRQLARKHSMPIFYTQDSHYEGDPEFAIWGEHARVGTPGWEIVPELAPDYDDGDRVFRKDRYDGFFRTNLDLALKQAAIESVILCGTVANICVLHTAASAAVRWYKVIVPIDAISALNDFDMQSAVRQIAFLFNGTITRVEALAVQSPSA